MSVSIMSEMGSSVQQHRTALHVAAMRGQTIDPFDRRCARSYGIYINSSAANFQSSPTSANGFVAASVRTDTIRRRTVEERTFAAHAHRRPDSNILGHTCFVNENSTSGFDMRTLLSRRFKRMFEEKNKWTEARRILLAKRLNRVTVCDESCDGEHATEAFKPIRRGHAMPDEDDVSCWLSVTLFDVLLIRKGVSAGGSPPRTRTFK